MPKRLKPRGELRRKRILCDEVKIRHNSIPKRGNVVVLFETHSDELGHFTTHLGRLIKPGTVRVTHKRKSPRAMTGGEAPWYFKLKKPVQLSLSTVQRRSSGGTHSIQRVEVLRRGFGRKKYFG